MVINTDPRARLERTPYETESRASVWTIIVALIAAGFIGWLIYAHSGQPAVTPGQSSTAAPVARQVVPGPDTPSPAAPPTAPAAPTAPAPTPPSAP